MLWTTLEGMCRFTGDLEGRLGPVGTGEGWETRRTQREPKQISKGPFWQEKEKVKSGVHIRETWNGNMSWEEHQDYAWGTVGGGQWMEYTDFHGQFLGQTHGLNQHK